MQNITEIIHELEQNQKKTRFNQLVNICETFFGKPRKSGGSHFIFKTPWPGEPRINLQSEQGLAKPYQVKQVIQALKKFQEIKNNG